MDEGRFWYDKKEKEKEKVQQRASLMHEVRRIARVETLLYSFTYTTTQLNVHTHAIIN